MKTRVDLHQLAVDRDAHPPAAAPSPRRRWHLLTRFVLPALLLAGFGALLAYAAWESLYPPRPVTVVPVVYSQAELDEPADTPLFRAAGWVEPRPTPIVVTALTEGVVDKLLVVEGQEVKAGQVLARLVTADAALALGAAEADVKLREGERAAARVALTAARTRLDQPVHLKAELADAGAAVARAETELGALPHLLRAAQARQRFAKIDYENKQRVRDAVAGSSLDKARSEVDAAEAAVEELQARQKRLPAEVAALKDKRDALSLKLKLKTDEVRQLGEAEAAVQTAEARLMQARTLRDVARLRLERTVIRAPISGRVLALVARPGTRLMGLAPGGMQESSTVVTLYDPARLQVRVDVRLEDVARVLPGQKVKIETAAVPGRSLDGEVLAATSQADIQKNTLSVKVAVKEPPSTLKADMLCQVTFLALPRPAGPAKKGAEPYRLLVPRQLVESSSEGSRVWAADLLSGRARLRRVELGLTAGELVEVVSGVDSTDRLIVGGRDGLKDGDRVRVVGEDETLGIHKAAGGGGGKAPPGGHRQH
jgi:RND family efflux transporter MFP subunit